MIRTSTICLLLFLFSPNANAKIWRVNNNASADADFTTAFAAHAGANPGDTLHFESSNNHYGSVTLTKRLVLIGLGHFLSANEGLQSTPVASRIFSLTLNSGSEGSVVSVAAENLSVNANNITIFRTQVAFLSINGSNAMVINCYIRNSITFGGSSSGSNISHNIIADRITMTANQSATITHNVINAIATNFNVIHNSNVHSNIFNKAATFNATNSIIEFNMCSNAALPEGNGNQRNIDMANVFVDNNSAVDNGFLLKPGAGNLAVGTGKNGADCGAFDGVSPFVLGMIPNVPTIYDLLVPAAPQGNSMEIKVSTRVNN